MGMRALLTIAILVLTVLGGCVGNEDARQDDPGSGTVPVDALGRPVIPADWYLDAIPQGPDHDHRDPAQHRNSSTPNFRVIGYDPLITDWHGRTSGDYFCGSVVERDGRALSVVHSFGSDVAFVLADVTDPAKPQKLGELVMENTQVYDVTMTPDQRYVLVASSPLDSGPDMETPEPPTTAPARTVAWRDACTGSTTPLMGPEAGLPFTSGLALVNIENPRNPFVVDFRPFPVRGAHSIRAAEFDGETLLLASVPNSVPFAPAQSPEGNYYASYYVFMTIEETPQGGTLTPVSVYQYEAENPTDVRGGMHDGFLQERHPVTGQALAYLAYGANGLVIVDISDPANPVTLSHWADWGVVGKAAPTDPYLHEALPLETTWDGRHYTFIGEECGGRPAETPTCLLFVLDTTDPAAPTFVGAWTLPVDVAWELGLQYSLHYIALSGRTLFAALYHGGVWALDVSTPEALRTLPAIGAFLPTNESPKAFDKPPRSVLTDRAFAGAALDLRPTVLDLEVLSDGTLVIWDGQSGIYTVAFDPTYPAPPPTPWPLGYNE